MSSSSSSSSGGKCRQLSLEEIIKATDNFNESNVIGKGGEGKVYLAKIKLDPDSEITHAAVKRLKKASKQFDVEIKAMSKIDHHPNLVSLLGYCNQAGKEMLVYEYLENGSLSHYLEKKSSISMSWQVRVSICIDAARGLSHLHAGNDEYPKGIIHRDVKPGNILLDKNNVAKISDFGLLKLSTLAQTQSEMRTNIKGTSGYFAPEYLARGTVTRKIDVYAFGVLLYEVLCLKRPWVKEEEDEDFCFTGDEDFGLLACENVDPTIKDEITDDALEIFTNIIRESMKKNQGERPTMDSVVSRLVEVALTLKSKEDEYEAKQGQAAATEPNSDHSTEDSYHRGESEEGKTSEAIVLDVGGDIAKAEVAEYDNPKAVSWSHPTKFRLDEILRATDNFNDARVIVRGFFGITYEGLLDDGRTVAVKRYDLDSHVADKCREEFNSLFIYHNDHIASIIGKCEDSEFGELIVVHESTKNRTLGYHLMEKKSTLSWEQRLRICIDAAKGLEYLHHCFPIGKRVIHRNVNPFTILLNEQLGAKLSVFGLSNTYRPNFLVITDVKGNDKYVDPHYNLTGILNRRSDIYSFGIVLFDVLFGMGYMHIQNIYSRRFLNEHTFDKIDKRMKGQISLECFKVFVEVAFSCTDLNPSERPTMTSVVEKLESALKILQQSQTS